MKREEIDSRLFALECALDDVGLTLQPPDLDIVRAHVVALVDAALEEAAKIMIASRRCPDWCPHWGHIEETASDVRAMKSNAKGE